jgi:hypothetical protein
MGQGHGLIRYSINTIPENPWPRPGIKNKVLIVMFPDEIIRAL